MKDITLTGEQLRDLFIALMTANVGSINASEVQILEYKPSFEASGVYHVMVRYSLTFDADHFTYVVSIGYFDERTNQNPETIQLLQVDHRKPEAESMSLGRLGYVSGKLREYGIW